MKRVNRLYTNRSYFDVCYAELDFVRHVYKGELKLLTIPQLEYYRFNKLKSLDKEIDEYLQLC